MVAWRASAIAAAVFSFQRAVPIPFAVTIIPARYESTRLPGKALAPIAGRPMIQHVYERARRATGVRRTLIATDDERIAGAARVFGGDVVMTRPHATGTDRVAEVASTLAEVDVVVNVQGDLPLLDPSWVSRAVAAFADPAVEMASLMTPIRDEDEWRRSSVVKVVTGSDGFALYFSRSPIPFRRNDAEGDVLGWRHIGLYAYRRATLLALAAAPRSPLERAEELEQLRALERGVRIKMIEVDSASPEVDTADDLERVRRLAEERGDRPA